MSVYRYMCIEVYGVNSGSDSSRVYRSILNFCYTVCYLKNMQVGELAKLPLGVNKRLNCVCVRVCVHRCPVME